MNQGRIEACLSNSGTWRADVFVVIERLLRMEGMPEVMPLWGEIVRDLSVAEGESFVVYGMGVGMVYGMGNSDLSEAMKPLHASGLDVYSLAVAHLVGWGLSDGVVGNALLMLVGKIHGLEDALDYALLRVGHVQAWVNEMQALRHLDKGDARACAVAMSVYCLLRAGHDSGRARHLAQMSKRASVMMLVDVLLGARWGEIWIDAGEDSMRVRKLSHTLLLRKRF